MKYTDQWNKNLVGKYRENDAYSVASNLKTKIKIKPDDGLSLDKLLSLPDGAMLFRSDVEYGTAYYQKELLFLKEYY